jgi:hypothetical protein
MTGRPAKTGATAASASDVNMDPANLRNRLILLPPVRDCLAEGFIAVQVSAKGITKSTDRSNRARATCVRRPRDPAHRPDDVPGVGAW